MDIEATWMQTLSHSFFFEILLFLEHLHIIVKMQDWKIVVYKIKFISRNESIL